MVISAAILFLSFGISSSYNVAYLAIYELFPVIYISTAYGVTNILGRGASTLAPLIAEVRPPLPMIAWATC